MKAINLSSQVGIYLGCLILSLIIISSYPTSVSLAMQPTVEEHLQLYPLPTKVSSLTNNSTSTTTNSTSLIFQRSSALGMTIKYPNDWKPTLASNKALILMPPLDKDNYSEILVIALFGISTNVSINQLSDQAIKNYGAHYSDFYIVNLKPISLEGKPAYLLRYSYTDPKAGTILTMNIGIKDGSKAYVISYSAEQQEYNSYLPTVETILHSFRLI